LKRKRKRKRKRRKKGVGFSEKVSTTEGRGILWGTK
jgi:hypothetical protein